MSEIMTMAITAPKEFNPDFSVLDYYDINSSFDMVVFAALSLGLNSEINEIQRIQNNKFSDFIKASVTEGLCNLGKYTYANGILSISNEYAIFDGAIFNLKNTFCPITNGQSLYLETWPETVSGKDFIYQYGDARGEKLVNNIIDPRIGKETSRRVQKVWILTTTRNPDLKSIYLGTLTNGALINKTISTPTNVTKSAKMATKIWSEDTSSTSSVRILKIDDVTSYDDIIGIPIFIKAYAAGTTAATTIDINNLGAKNLAFPSISSSNMATGAHSYDLWVRTGQPYGVVFDGANFNVLFVNPRSASVNSYGLTILNNSVSSTSTTQAATPAAVKTAYDAAIAAQSSVTTLAANSIPPNEKGAANGVASLDSNKKIPSEQLPLNTIISSTIWEESGTSTATVRSITIPGITAMSQIINVPIHIKASVAGSINASTLSINGLTGFNIQFPATDATGLTVTPNSNYWVRSGQSYIVNWTGSYFVILNPQITEASTVNKGIVQLNDTLTSTSTKEAATANAVRAVYERAEKTVLLNDIANQDGSFYKQDVAPTGTSLLSYSGILKATKIYGTTFNDIAEGFYCSELVEPGDIIQLCPGSCFTNTENEKEPPAVYVKSKTALSPLVRGVVSDTAFMYIGESENTRPIALLGRVRVKLVGQGKPGQWIVSSDIEGVGMALDEPVHGCTLGQLEEYKYTKYVERVWMFIKNL